MDANNGLQLIDREALISQFEGDEEILQEIVMEFIDICPDMLQEIKTAIKNNDSHALHQSAHGFKGAVSNFFAQKVTEQAFRLEQLGKNGQVSEADQLFPAMTQDVDRLLNELKQLGKIN